MQNPRKIQSVHVEELDNEVCVYDWEQKVVHNLNPTAALVWEQCDGSTSPAQIAQKLQAELDTPHPEDMVWITLNELEQAQLLENEVAQPAGSSSISRRTMLKQMGVAAALLPAVVSIVAPSPAQAQSPVPGAGGGVSGTWLGAGAAPGGAGPMDGLNLSAAEIAASAAALCPGGLNNFSVNAAADANACQTAAAGTAGVNFYRFGSVGGASVCYLVDCV